MDLRVASNAPHTSQVLDLDDALTTVDSDADHLRMLTRLVLKQIDINQEANGLRGARRMYGADRGNADNEDIIRAFKKFGADAFYPVQDCLPGLEQVSTAFSQNTSGSASDLQRECTHIAGR